MPKTLTFVSAQGQIPEEAIIYFDGYKVGKITRIPADDSKGIDTCYSVELQTPQGALRVPDTSTYVEAKRAAEYVWSLSEH